MSASKSAGWEQQCTFASWLKGVGRYGEMDAHLGLQADQARLAAMLERKVEACREGSGDGLREVEEEA